MEITLEHNGITYKTDLSQPISIASILYDDDNNPNCYYADKPKFETIRSGDFVGSVAERGSVNYRKLHFSPHGNGTHTECYGHISADPEATLDKCLVQSNFIAQLISVSPETLANGDKVIGWESIQPHLLKNIKAIVIKALPHHENGQIKQWSGTNPPYFSYKIGEELADRGIKHLLTDLPSVDREIDGGELKMHNAFWQLTGDIRKDATITELAIIPPTVKDGLYLLNLQAPRINSDAAPSHPTLYFLKPV